MKHIFISYARVDHEFALRLARELRASGVSVWIDQLDILPGDPWDRTIENALRDCRRLIVVLSPASVASENVQDEIAFAIHHRKPIIPVLFQPCDIPFRLLRRQRINFTSDFEYGIKLLQSALGAKKGAAQSPSHVSGVGQESQYSGKKKTIPAGMVLIPAGSFLMGSEDGNSNEQPVHKVELDAFYMDQHEVTVGEFKRFIDATGHTTDAEKEGWSYAWTGSSWEKKKNVNWRHNAEGHEVTSDAMNHPVIHVSWRDAMAYTNWAGKRLPTEAEWEYAARSGQNGYKYSWGNGDPEGKRGGNIADEAAKRVFKNWSIWEGYDDGFVFTAPVGSFDPNDFGLYDMSGNVWEWCADWYDADYYTNSPKRNPKGPDKGERRVLRGGSWDDGPLYVRCALRDWYFPTDRNLYVGFRCVQDAL